MPTQVSTATSELGDSRVRVDVEVPPETVEKELEGAELLSRARELVNLCRKHKVLCIINDRADIALLADVAEVAREAVGDVDHGRH